MATQAERDRRPVSVGGLTGHGRPARQQTRSAGVYAQRCSPGGGAWRRVGCGPCEQMSSFEGRRDPPPKGPFARKPEDRGGDLLWRQHSAPLDRAIFWYPAQTVTTPHSGRNYLRFITLGALKEIALHVKAAPDQGKLGFLTGGSFSCPNSKVRYVVIDATLRDPDPVRDDRTSEAVTMLWVSLQEQLRSRNRELLGWYHTHPAGGLELTASDIITHSRFFPAPWQTAMLLEPGAERPRAVVCEAGEEKPPNTVLLPFYELLEPETLLTKGVRPDYVSWQNYRTVTSPEEPIDAAAAAVFEAGSPPNGPSDFRPRVLLPSQVEYEFGWSWSSLRRWLGQHRALRRLLQLAGLAAIILVIAALWKLTSGREQVQMPTFTSQPAPTVVSASLRRLDQIAEQVGEAVSNYEERAWLFDTRKMTCADLATAFAQTVDLWFAYNTEGRSKVTNLDPERSEREESLLAGVREVEVHFGASGCPTP